MEPVMQGSRRLVEDSTGNRVDRMTTLTIKTLATLYEVEAVFKATGGTFEVLAVATSKDSS